MTRKDLDHYYHRSRVDAHISGNIAFVAVVAVLALTVGERFKPFQHGARMLEPSRLVWLEREQAWFPERILVDRNDFPPALNRGELCTREIYPISLSIVFVMGCLAVAGFIYACARRQTYLMSAVFADQPDMAYQRPWREVRVTFWALDVVLLFVLLILLA
jgi:hypothetical protein